MDHPQNRLIRNRNCKDFLGGTVLGLTEKMKDRPGITDDRVSSPGLLLRLI